MYRRVFGSVYRGLHAFKGITMPVYNLCGVSVSDSVYAFKKLHEMLSTSLYTCMRVCISIQ